MAGFTSGQLLGLEITARASSVVSILGSLFIVSTFLCSSGFRTNKTRLIFFATWGNMVTNIATLISVSAIPPDKYDPTPLCQIQGFLIQWFMLADPFWVFCMAFNVWCVFIYKRFDAHNVRKLEKWYIMFAYGCPAVSATAYMIHDHTTDGRILGPAIIWCWVGEQYDWMRIAFFYAPLWILAGATMAIHIRIAYKVYKAKMDLRKIKDHSLEPSSPVKSENPFWVPANNIVVTTNISQRSRIATPEGSQISLTPSYSLQRVMGSDHTGATNGRDSPVPWSSTKSPGSPAPLVPMNPNSPHRHRNPRPLGRYRATAYAAPMVSGGFATLPTPHVPMFRPTEHAAHLKRRKETADMFSYFKIALLLFVALLAVWGPSSINRLHQMLHPQNPSYGLNLASTLVLPMQGFWNALIYAQATWSTCKRVFSVKSRRTAGQSSEQSPAASMLDTPTNSRASASSGSTEVASGQLSAPDKIATMV